MRFASERRSQLCAFVAPRSTTVQDTPQNLTDVVGEVQELTIITIDQVAFAAQNITGVVDKATSSLWTVARQPNLTVYHKEKPQRQTRQKPYLSQRAMF
jgi:hypothetical protein